MTKNVMIYWFSGTGNSLFVAKQVKKNLDALGYDCSLKPMEKQSPFDVPRGTTIGIVVPVAMQGTFPLVWYFLKHLPVVNGSSFFLVDTLGAYSGGIKGPVKKIIKKKGFTPAGAVEIIMPNFFLRKKESDKDEQKRERAVISVREFCGLLHENKARWNDIPVYSTLLGSIFNSRKKAIKWVKLFPKKITGKCINCGICRTLCPANCTDFQSNHIKEDSEKCILCMRCLEYCPVNAIEMKGLPFIKNTIIPVQEMKKSLGM